MVNIKGIRKHIVLYALWKASHTQGLSFLGLNPNGFTLERAEELVDERLFDRDCGDGAAVSAIESIADM